MVTSKINNELKEWACHWQSQDDDKSVQSSSDNFENVVVVVVTAFNLSQIGLDDYNYF